MSASAPSTELESARSSESVHAHFLISLVLLSVAEQLHSMLSSYGRSSLPSPFSDRLSSSLQSSTTSASTNPLTSILSHPFTNTTTNTILNPGLVQHRVSSSSPSRDESFPYHPAAFASYQNSLKLKKQKKARPTKIGPDGIPLKRKSREGSTTYLWEFLLKLLQVSHQ